MDFLEPVLGIEAQYPHLLLGEVSHIKHEEGRSIPTGEQLSHLSFTGGAARESVAELGGVCVLPYSINHTKGR